MKLLGISELDNDAGAVLFVDGVMVGAANEERFSRVKLQAGVPRQAIDWLLRKAGLRPRELDLVAIVKPEPRAEIERMEQVLAEHDFWHSGPIKRRALDWLLFRGYRRVAGRREIRRLGRQMAGWLEQSGLSSNKVVRAHHHRSHAASAFFASGFPRALAVTCDGQGGGVSASVYRGEGAAMELLHEVHAPSSMGFFYAMVTRALGFRPARHEGKVTGLAARAAPDPDTLALFRELVQGVDGGFVTRGVYGALGEVKKRARACGREPVAAAAQLVLEEIVSGYVAEHARRTGVRQVALAGGVFANVRLNQRILDLDEVDEVFVFPHMADGGLGYGAVVDLMAGLQGHKTEPITDVYWGPGYSDAEIEAALLRSGIDYVNVPDIERRVARLLANGATVARFDGRMEFGPRALGNRSILCRATDSTVNDWLNQRLGRSEFMPFAPVARVEDADLLFERSAGARRAAEFMTITLDCTKAFRAACPAVVHVDGTARPQLVAESTNPRFYGLVDAYHEESGLPALINTSFNLHEEPIVMTPDDALRVYQRAQLDALAMGDFLCQRRSR